MKTTSPKQIRIWLFSRADMSKVGDAVLAALNEDPELAPERMGLFEPFRVNFQSPAASELWRSEAQNEVGLLGAERKRPTRIGMTVSFGITPARPFHTLSWNADARVLELPNAIERIDKLFRRLVVAFESYWGAAFDSNDFEEQNVLRDFQHVDGTIEPYKIAGVDLRKALPGLYWLNFFGPILCDFIGAQKIKAVVPSAEGLDDGLLLRLANSPADMLSETVRDKVNKIRRDLGEDLFFDIQQVERATRAPALPTPPPMTPPATPIVTSIREPDKFVKTANARASAWRAKHQVASDVGATLHALEAELDAIGQRAPSEEMLADLAAVLGQLVIEQVGGRWVAASEPYVVTTRGREVYPVSQILKRAVDPDASLGDWLNAATGSTSQ